MTHVTIPGAAGRMGRTLIAMILADPHFTLAGATEQPEHPLLGTDAGTLVGADACGIHLTASMEEALRNADTVIDFTAPAATLSYLPYAIKHQVNMVIGTTGFTAAQEEQIHAATKNIAIVKSGNMSVGINLLLSLVKKAATVLGTEYDIEIIEAHHRHKKDAPSGTAAMLADAAATGHGATIEDTGVYGRHGMPGERPVGEIGVHAVRAGDIIGEHTVLFGGPGERLELAHKAHSRDIFAQGALRAANFLKKSDADFYTMHDVLNLD